MTGKTIIFGASGFIGRSLVKLLDKNGGKVIGHSSKTCDLTSPEAVQIIARDVQDGDSVVLISGLTPEKGKPLELTFRNLEMAKHLLAGLEGRSLAQFIYASSDAVYPMTADMVDETTPLLPPNLYGEMHVMREGIFRERFAPDVLTILRPCAIYGVGEPHNAYDINRFIRSAREQGKIELFGGGEEYRDHVHVDDVAAHFFAALKRKITGTYNIATGTSWRFAEIAQAVATGCKKEVAIIHKPRAMPIYHRHVNIALSRSIFPECLPRSIKVGIEQLLRETA